MGLSPSFRTELLKNGTIAATADEMILDVVFFHGQRELGLRRPRSPLPGHGIKTRGVEPWGEGLHGESLLSFGLRLQRRSNK